MSKFSIFAVSFFILFALVCQNDSLALASGHHKKHKSTQAIEIPPEPSVHSRHSRNRISSKHRLSHKTKHIATKTRYAYPMGFFLMEPPTFDSSPLPEETSMQIKKAFFGGYAGDYPTRSLVRTGLATYYPMRGGIFWRREPIKYIIMHSTEPGISVGAKTIVDGWSHGGRRHAGAHYVIDRDGTIYQAVDPDLATVHINIFKTLPGINNDNSVGIEMCHHGSQDYPPALLESAIRLAAYLQSHYHVADANIITHRYAQQGDHTDPVNFAWDNFIAQKDSLQNQGLNQKLALMKSEGFNWHPVLEQPPIVVVDKKPPSTSQKTDLTIIDLTKKSPPESTITAPKPGMPKLVPTDTAAERVPQPKVEYKTQSAFDAKFGSINKPTTESPFEAKFGIIDRSDAESLTQVKAAASDKPAADVKSSSLAGTVNKPAVDVKSNGLAGTVNKPAADVKSNVVAGTIDKATTEKQVAVEARAPMSVPISAPSPSNRPPRLLPSAPTNRLVPFSMIINTPRQGNSVSQQNDIDNSLSSSHINRQSNSSLLPVNNSSSKRLLPLRGPIEMDPDEAATLLGQ